MLKMLTCDIFRIDPKTGKPYVIKFEKGLNVIRGTGANKNSIGKSTALLLIDFALGGLDYENTCSTTIDIKGEHTIKFIIEIGGTDLYCSRSTQDSDVITLYKDDTFTEVLATMSNNDYLKELQRLHQLPNEFTYRQMVGPYLRIYQRQTTNEKQPLHAAITQQCSDAISNYLKLNNMYNDLQNLLTQKEQLDDKIKTYKKSGDYKYIRKIGKEEYEKNLKKIDEDKKKLQDLTKSYEDSKYNQQVEVNSESSSIATMLVDLNNKKDNLVAKYKSIDTIGKVDKDKFDKSLSELKQFFPNEDFKNIEDTESFHYNIAGIFNEQVAKEKNKLNKIIKDLDEEIAKYEEKYKRINHIEKVPQTIMRQYYDLEDSIKKMEEENKNYLQNLKNKNDLDAMNQNIANQSKSILDNLEIKINNGLADLNKSFYEGKKYPPNIKFNGIDKKYIFRTPKDDGTGTSQKGVILFDIFTLKETKLPIIIHDTIMLKHIEDYTLQEIVKLYNQITDKQVIIAFDGDKKIDEETNQILTFKTRMELGPKEMALFGKEFNE